MMMTLITLIVVITAITKENNKKKEISLGTVKHQLHIRWNKCME